MKRFACLTVATAVVSLVITPAVAGIVGWANWNTEGVNTWHDRGQEQNLIWNPELHRTATDANPYYTGPSPGDGNITFDYSTEGVRHAEMVWPGLSATAARFGAMGLDCSQEANQMIYLTANAAIQDSGGNPVGVLRTLLDERGTLEFWFKPNWDPATDTEKRYILSAKYLPASNVGWQLTRNGGGASVLVSEIADLTGTELGHDVAGDLIDDWNHIALSWDDTGVRTYLNGVKAGQTMYAGPSPRVQWNDGHQILFVGGGGNGEAPRGIYWANGSYDALAMWDSAEYIGDTYDVPTEEPGMPATLDGDLNDDGFVGQGDLDIVLGAWGTTPPSDTRADPNDDNFVGQADLDAVLGDWGMDTPPTPSVPEPATLGIFTLCGFALLRRKPESW